MGGDEAGWPQAVSWVHLTDNTVNAYIICITICLYHFSHHEKHQGCNLSINKSRMLFERKRKRQVLEEEDEISADEMEKLKNEMEGFPSDFVLPKDTTGTSTAHDMYMMHGLFTIIHQFATCEICACSP